MFQAWFYTIELWNKNTSLLILPARKNISSFFCVLTADFSAYFRACRILSGMNYILAFFVT